MFAVKGKEDVTIHVRDRGGGIPRRLMGPIFEYLYTTANPVVTSSHEVHVRNQSEDLLARVGRKAQWIAFLVLVMQPWVRYSAYSIFF